MSWFWITMALLALFSCVAIWMKRLKQRRQAFINEYEFPPGLFDRLARKRPGFSAQDHERIGQALRQYFRAYLDSGFKFVSMPSQLADDLWHEFILYTRNYQRFCQQAFGRFFHHTPAVALNRHSRESNAGLRRVWWFACKEEGINPRVPERLPLLFGLDGEFQIEGGFYYSSNCKSLPSDNLGGLYCGGDFSDSSFDGGTEGFGDSSGDGGDSGLDSGGDNSSDSGGGCGGGCGGGGD